MRSFNEVLVASPGVNLYKACVLVVLIAHGTLLKRLIRVNVLISKLKNKIHREFYFVL